MERSAADRVAIEELHRRDEAASRAQDFATLRTLMSPDAVVLAPGSAAKRGPEVHASLSKQETAVRGVRILDYRFEWEELQIAHNYAFEWGRIVGAVEGADGQPIPMRYNVMRVLQRQENGSWLVHRTIWNEAPAR